MSSTAVTDDSKTNSKRRPGRFDPDQPLHMTTRRAARNYGSTPSLNGSVDGGDSRRGSFDGHRPSSSNGSQSDPKQRLSNASEQAATTSPHATKSDSSPSGESKLAAQENILQPIAPYAPAVSPLLKRKRSSSPPSPVVAVAAPVIIERPPPDEPDADNDPDGPNSKSDLPEHLKVADDDQIESTDVGLDIPASQVTEAPSELSSQPSDHNADDEALPVAASTDETPMISTAPSPASSIMSDRDRRAKPADIADDAADDAADSVAMADVDGDEGEAIDGAEDADDLNDDDGPAQSDDDETRPRRRMGGRRRAAHPNPKVEAAMRRQAELKSGYRAIARQLKLVLLEITHRTLEDLKADEESHLKATEYGTVKAGLDEALSSFQQRAGTERELKMKLIAQELEAEQEVRRSRCRLAIEELQDQQLADLEHRMISIERQAQMADNDDTEDEDGDVVPKIKKAWYRHHRGPALDAEYESRSRVILETECMTDKLEARMKMARALRDLSRDNQSAPNRQFTVMNATPRLAAIARREERNGLKLLVDAAVEEERPSEPSPVIPNSEAFGLQILGELASRPSIMAPPEFVGPFGQHPSMAVPPQPQAPVYASGLPPPPEGYHTPIHQMSPAKSRIHTDSAGRTGPDTLSPRKEGQALQHLPQLDRMPLQRPFPEQVLEAHRPREPPPFQPLRLPGYPGRQFEFAPDDSPNYRQGANPPLFGNFRHAPVPPPPAPYFDKTGPLPHDERSRYEYHATSPRSSSVSKPPNVRDEAMLAPELKEEPRSRDILNRPAGESGSGEDRFHVPNQQSPALPPKRSFDATKSPRPSSGSATETTSGDASQRSSKTKTGQHRKPNKDERGGASRRQSKFSIKRPHGHSQSSGNVSHIFQSGALNPAEQAHLTPAWDSANPVPPPPSSYALPPPPYHGAPPYHSYGPFPPPPPLPPPGEHGHRSSTSALPPFTGGWPQNGPSGSYPVPPPPDHWPQIPPPPYPGQHSQHGRPPGSSGSGSNQYAGPALAPASQAPRNPTSGAGTSHLPAFAQQQRNGEGQRRRTQSDSQPKIHQWTPGGQGRR